MIFAANSFEYGSECLTLRAFRRIIGRQGNPRDRCACTADHSRNAWSTVQLSHRSWFEPHLSGL